jgi:hypothetical protein
LSLEKNGVAVLTFVIFLGLVDGTKPEKVLVGTIRLHPWEGGERYVMNSGP